MKILPGRTRRALLRSAGVVNAGTTAGCIGLGQERFEDNCSEDTLSEGPASATGAGRWPGYGACPERAAAVTSSGPDDPGLAWRYATCDPMGETSPVLVDGTVFVALVSRPGTRALYAATGEELWTDRFTGRAPGHAYVDGTLYVAGHGVRALSAASGEVRWTFRPERPNTEDGETDGGPLPLYAAPAAVEGTVFVPGGIGDAALCALDASEGSVRWRTELEGDGLSKTPAVGPDAVYVPDGTRRLLALDRATGAIRWTVEDFDAQVRTPAVAGDRLYVGTGNHVRSLTLDGETVWRSNAIATSGSIAVDGERVYASAENTLTAVDVDGGDQVWTAGGDVPRTLALGPPAVDDGAVYVGRQGDRTDDGPEGAVVAFDAESGAERWRVATRGIPAGEGGPYAGTREQLAVGDGTVFVTTDAGDLLALADP